MEDYSKGSAVEVEDTQKVEAHEEDNEGVEFVRDDIAAVNEENSSSSNSNAEDTDEKVVSDSVVVSLAHELSRDIAPSRVDSDADESDAKETEDNINIDDSPILTGLNKETEQFSSAESTRDPQLFTDVGSKEIDNETTTLQSSDNNAGNSSGFTKLESDQNVEDSLDATNVLIVETRDDASELVNKPDIDESMENQPIIPLRHRLVQPTSWKCCCGLFEVLRSSDR